MHNKITLNETVPLSDKAPREVTPVAHPDLKMSWVIEGKSREAQNEALDREVERFSHWMATLADERARGALNNPEKAIIKTYLVQKLGGKLDGGA